MKHPYVKSVVAALLLGGLLGGCATTVEMGGPLAYYRYHYETGAPVTYSTQPATVVYQEPATVYRERTAVYRQPTAVYREPTIVYREPTTVYREPTVYSYRYSASRRMAAYSYDLDDHGQ